MAARPKGGLDGLVVPKGAEPAAASSPSPAATGMKAYAHTLSLRLTAEQYRALRMFVRAEEDKTGGRVTHQSIIEMALAEYLERNG